ncbi:MAG: D-alanine--D-alanine ligase family protein [Phycisphaerales bacterium]
MKPLALVLGGGPDAERSVSLKSSEAVARAIEASGAFEVALEIIDRPASLAGFRGEVVFPVLHGAWGEGGPLQDLLIREGRPFVGCGPAAARLCMDKMATKLAAARAGVRTPAAAVLNPTDAACPFAPPVVVKPVHEGSSVGLFICRDERSLERAFRPDGAVRMVERLIDGRELTCGLLDRGNGLEALPLIEISPAEGVYDFAAKYDRDDTRYTLDPVLPEPADAGAIRADALRVGRALGVRHLARVDFLLDDDGQHWLLEVNTMPGFTGHSLLPKAAAARGIELPELCAGLCRLALAEDSRTSARSADA